LAKLFQSRGQLTNQDSSGRDVTANASVKNAGMPSSHEQYFDEEMKTERILCNIGKTCKT